VGVAIVFSILNGLVLALRITTEDAALASRRAAP
jgi:isoprenylcysteine carboxyl methyltransferase (ICMT) family protein YpbQ